jgi:hypothetical protein
METPSYLKTFNPDILQSIKVGNIDIEKGTFAFEIVFYDPTDDLHTPDETGLVKKSATGTGEFRWEEGLSESEADTEDDMYPEIEWITFAGVAVSDEMWTNVHDEIYDKLPQPQVN